MRSSIYLLIAAVALHSSDVLPVGYCQEEAPRFHTGAAVVSAWVHVTDGGKVLKPIRGLLCDDFRLLDEGAPQELLSCEPDRANMDIVVVVDVLSLSFARNRKFLDDFERAVQRQPNGDRIGLIRLYGGEHEVLAGLTDDLDSIARAISRGMRGRGRPPTEQRLYDAVGEATKLFREESEERTRVILLVTNGRERFSQVSGQESAREALRANAVVVVIELDAARNRKVTIGFPIPPGAIDINFPDNDSAAAGSLDSIVEQTGGVMFSADQVASVFDIAFSAMRDRYLLSYRAPLSRAGEWRSIEVSLAPSAIKAHPSAVLRVRAGYFAPEF